MSIYLIKPTNPKSTAVERSCLNCKRIFYTSASDLKFNRSKYCSKKCKDILQRGEKHGSWKPKPTRICLNCQEEYEIEAWRLTDKTKNRGVFCSAKCQKQYYIGENAPNWKGGITPINHKIRTSRAMEKWRNAVLQRDNHQCIWCGSTENLEADHIKPFAEYPELRLDVDNGRTLCRPCHITTFTKAVAYA